ncbi:SpoIIE family protein phosphatase [Streptomyces roseus]
MPRTVVAAAVPDTEPGGVAATRRGNRRAGRHGPAAPRRGVRGAARPVGGAVPEPGGGALHTGRRDPSRVRRTYSCDGHLPPALLRRDGTVGFLDQATDPPLGARPVEHLPRPEGTTGSVRGDTPVLDTDGPVERRREEIDVGLGRPAAALVRW